MCKLINKWINSVPMQIRGPSPKLKNEKLFFVAFDENLSGLNFSGLGYIFGSF